MLHNLSTEPRLGSSTKKVPFKNSMFPILTYHIWLIYLSRSLVVSLLSIPTKSTALNLTLEHLNAYFLIILTLKRVQVLSPPFSKVLYISWYLISWRSTIFPFSQPSSLGGALFQFRRWSFSPSFAYNNWPWLAFTIWQGPAYSNWSWLAFATFTHWPKPTYRPAFAFAYSHWSRPALNRNNYPRPAFAYSGWSWQWPFYD